MKIDRTLVTVAVSVVAIVGIGVAGGVALLSSGGTSHPSQVPARQVADVTTSPAPRPSASVAESSPASPAAAVHHVVRPSKPAVVVHRVPKVSHPKAVQTQEAPVSEPTADPTTPPAEPSDTPTADPSGLVLSSPGPIGIGYGPGSVGPGSPTSP